MLSKHQQPSNIDPMPILDAWGVSSLLSQVTFLDTLAGHWIMNFFLSDIGFSFYCKQAL